MKKDWHELISQAKFSITEERDVLVPMRDGEKLAINVFKPAAKGKFPVLISLSPYVKDLQDCYWLPPQPIDKGLWDGSIEASDTSYVVSRGYAHIIADQRGTGKSGGLNRGTKGNGEDGYDLVEWAARQPWCDGNVGMAGYSAYSAAQFFTAVEQPPHLKTIYFSGTSPDAYRGSNYTGGVLCLFPLGLEKTVGTSGMNYRDTIPMSVKTLPPEDVERRRQELLNNPDIKYCPNAYQILHVPYKNPRFFDTLLNPYDGPFWWSSSPYAHAHEVKVPVHLTAPWGHFYMPVGIWKMYDGLNVPKKLMFTASRHDPRPWRTALDVQIRWYDHWLKGNNTGMMDEPPISLYISGINQWRNEKEWPLPGTKWKKFYLRCWEELSTEPEIFTEEPDGFMQQPLYMSSKRDTCSYLTPPMSADMAVIGPAALIFYASIDQNNTSWIVKLYDVDEKGSEVMYLGTSYLKASHRAVDKSKSKPYAPWHPHTRESEEEIRPGKIYEYAIELLPLGHVFKVGHRLKLQIGNVESPKDPEMLLHYHPHLANSKTIVHKIYRDKKHQSHLLLPIFQGE